MLQKCLAVFLVVLCVACSSEPAAIDVQYLAGQNKYPAQPYITQLTQPPSGPYTQIAIINATGGPGLTKDQLSAIIQQKAEALGANAMIVTDKSQASAPPSVTLSPAGGQYFSAPALVTPALSVLAIYVAGQ